ncbi:bifunctional phosphopantothenoylcysteine decarboxylase/phosphopantothenate--cysteine ligase CoaBC [Bacteriovorax sp. Seq25_V]|uniref:bifunctional phosphopantothenoylcysteine decarboxylase/phosphopantothenate--cysteine ligase CoaBC n=1 Tax=Bacteriovorax sp. Seq25_V TaxID=1201288 RepID=UPI00038A42BC|nr:bifunctional phosphopantothenoylcysteine decarboxylase/phosphopantothenate--cysteine ligase CoaBC [Bacteriovorax sp. Seq25_V]EQC47151.1 phosphopantothenoylcysteine decarboxylase/phosphopantothenate--cysteine ligase [Bacteriovorax sp. Seq25_V]
MRILLGVCGSIAAYKTYDLARGLQKEGHEVKVVLTKGASEFVQAKLFKYLGVKEVYEYSDDFKNLTDSILHIELAKWAEHLAIFPASANTISKLAMGQCDDLLTSTFMAKRTDTIVSIYPAMNTFMWTHPITKENIDLIQRLYIAKNIFIHPPSEGLLACGDEGSGKAPDIQKVINCISAINPSIDSNSPLCLINTGATIAPIDPVRYVTNSSTGITGFQLAKEALKRGYRVVLIAGKNATSKIEDLAFLPGFESYRITTTRDMREKVLEYFDKADFYISSAAISDIEFSPSEQKLKKDKLENALFFNQAPDILKEMVERKTANKSAIRIVGFAAETDLSFEVLNKKWTRKPVDLLVGTLVHSGLCHDKKVSGFANNEASYKFFQNGEIILDEIIQKADLPSAIFRELEKNG